MNDIAPTTEYLPTAALTTSSLPGYGHNVTSDRIDALDIACLKEIERLRGQKGGLAPVTALDIGGGHGVVSSLMADRGAQVMLVELHPNPQAIIGKNAVTHLHKSIADLNAADVERTTGNNKIDVIYSQRALHYLPFNEAVTVLKRIREQWGSKQCKLFLSLTGVDSDLGREGYSGKDHPVDAPQRHCIPINQDANECGICMPMTLYDEASITRLLNESGFCNAQISKSPFGTFKVTAENELSINKGRGAGTLQTNDKRIAGR